VCHCQEGSGMASRAENESWAGRRGRGSRSTARSPSPFEPKINQLSTKLVYLEIGHSGRVCWLLGQPLA